MTGVQTCALPISAELAAALIELLQNPAQATELGERGKKFYQSHFTPEQNYVMLREVYASACEQRA